MLQTLLGTIWRRTPIGLRRLGVRLIEPRFRVTVGAVVVDDAGRVLLLKHVLRWGSGWGIPGGFIERREQPEAAIKRELREEVGLEIADLKLITVRAIPRADQVEIIYRCRPANESAAKPRSIEISRAAWFAPNAYPANLNAIQRRLIEQALSA